MAKQKEKIPASPKRLYATMEIVPRNYCFVWYADSDRKGGQKFYMDPATHVIASALRTSPAQNERKMSYAQRYNRRYEDLKAAGKAPYIKLFPWSEELLKMTPEALAKAMREAIGKEEGQYTLWDAEPHDALRNLTIRGEVLSANVKSKSAEDILDAYHKGVSMRKAFLDAYGEFNLEDMICSCQDHKWARTKGGDFQDIRECLHIAAMADEFNERLYGGESPKSPMTAKSEDIVERGKKRGAFSPFRFARNWRYEGSELVSRDKNLAALEMDVLVARYIYDIGYAGINRHLMLLPVFEFPQLTVSALRSGRGRFEILKQELAERGISAEEARARHYAALHFRNELFRRGYERTGDVFDLGFPAIRYEKGASIVDAIFSPEYQFCIRREMRDAEPKMTEKAPVEESPLRLLGRTTATLDDASRIVTNTTVDMLSRIHLPEGVVQMNPISRFFKGKWRSDVKKMFGDSEAKLKYAGLYY